MRLPQLLAVVALAAACSSHSTSAQPSTTPSPTAKPISSPAVAPKPLGACKAPALQALNTATKSTWKVTSAMGDPKGCHVTATTTAGGTLDLDVTPSSTVELDLADRQRNLPKKADRHELALGGASTGAAYLGTQSVQFLLYAGDNGVEESILLNLPLGTIGTDDATLSRVASSIVTWAGTVR